MGKGRILSYQGNERMHGRACSRYTIESEHLRGADARWQMVEGDTVPAEAAEAAARTAGTAGTSVELSSAADTRHWPPRVSIIKTP